MDVEVAQTLFRSLYGDENILLIAMAIGIGVWALSTMFIALDPGFINSDWWTFISAMALSLTYWVGFTRLLVTDPINYLLEISEWLVILGLSWVAATAYRRLFPHLSQTIVQGMINAHTEHFSDDPADDEEEEQDDE